MHWVAPSEKDQVTGTLEKRLWDTADQFRANSGIKVQAYSGSILGVIFIRFADVRFAAHGSKLEFARTPRELRQRFATLVDPMVRCMVQLYSTIQNLIRTRDLLLPRLLLGQLTLHE